MSAFQSLKPLRERRALLVLLILILNCGCGCFAFRKPLPPAAGERLDPAQTGLELARIRAAADRIHSLRGLARTRVSIDGTVSKLRYAVVYRKPDRLRLETLPTTSTVTLSLLVAKDQEAVFVDPLEKTAYYAEWNSGLSRHLFGAPLAETELMSLIAGRISKELLQDPDTAVYRDMPQQTLTVVDGRAQRYWILDAETRLLREARLYSRSGTLQLHWVYGSYQEADGELVPEKFSVQVPDEDLLLELFFTTLSVNGDFPEALYEVSIPADYRRR